MEKTITRYIFKGDKVIWTVFLTLCVLSCIEVFSASSRIIKADSYWLPISRHIMFIVGGIFVTWFIHNWKIDWIKKPTLAIYFIGVILLVYALLNGDRVNESARWVTILGQRFQPLEIAKMGLVMITALILSKAQTESGTYLSLKSALSIIKLQPQKDNDKRDYTLLAIIAVASVPCTFILFENLSTVVIIGITLLMMMFIGRVNKKQMLGMIGLVAVFGGICYGIIISVPEFEESDKVRTAEEKGFMYNMHNKMLTWKHRLVDAGDDNKTETPKEYYNRMKREGNEQKMFSKTAIGTSGLIGKGPGNSIQRDNIPHAHSDFLYSIIIEELGLLGGIGILLLYLTLLYRSGKIANNLDDPFAAFLVMGSAMIITIQALLHMHISVGDFVTGQPLPLMSQGGTSIIINCAYIGFILSASREVKNSDNKANNENIPEANS